MEDPFKAKAPDETEAPTVPTRGALGYFDVFALIVNKMIGTGIYTAPATVFLMTGNKSLTLGLFAVGFVYSLLSMIIYLDYAAVFPFNGGELVYLDEITSHAIEPDPPNPPLDEQGRPKQWPSRYVGLKRAILGDGLLAYIIYSLIFIAFFNSGSNSMQFGRMVLICIAADQVGDNDQPPDVNRDVMRLIGVMILSIICLLQYFRPAIGRKLNKFLAIVKILFLVGLIIVAAVASSGNLTDLDGRIIDRKDDWHEWYEVKSQVAFAKGLLAVLFSFEGWENATFVAGEIPRDKQHILRFGFIAAVLTVGLLYLWVVAAVLDSITWYELNASRENINYAPMLSGNGTHARRAWAIVSAISSFGSLNAIIYTFSRVKQAIGQADILPWSRYLKLDDSLKRPAFFQNTQESELYLSKAPQGGLIVHWIMSVVVIAGSASIKNTIESVGLPGYIQTYLHCFVLTIIGLSYWNLKAREKTLAIQAPDQHPNEPTGVNVAQTGLFLFILLYTLLNLSILVINVYPPYTGSDGGDKAFEGFGFPILVGAICLIGTVYYILFFGAAERVYPQPLQLPDSEEGGQEMMPFPPQPVREQGILSPQSAWNLTHWAGVTYEIKKDHHFNPKMERVYRFGRRWWIDYSLPGGGASGVGFEYSQHSPEGSTTQPPEEAEPEDAPAGRITWSRFLYWFFGGTRLRQNPWDVIKKWWQDLMGSTARLLDTHLPRVARFFKLAE